MVKIGLDGRKQKILRAIIDSYVDSAEPVGSRTLARKFDLGVSPATIRNEMADLEELGYLEQPHTSAGRIPSDKGYRFYVDFLMQARQIAEQEMLWVQDWYHTRSREIDWLIQQTAKILSQMTNYTCLVSGPSYDRKYYRYLQLLPVNQQSAVLVLVTGTGSVEHELIELPPGITEKEAEKIAQILNDRLRGMDLEAVKQAMLRDLDAEFARHLSHYRLVQAIIGQFSDVLERTYASKQEERVYLGGATNILYQPEFHDVDKARAILGLLEEEKSRHQLLATAVEGAITISIGQENKLAEMQNCSVVTASYAAGRQAAGAISILGPTRMDYGRVVAVLELFARNLSNTLGENALRQGSAGKGGTL